MSPLVIFLIILCIWSSGWATEPITLREAVEMALERNPSIRVSRYEPLLAEQEAEYLRGEFSPEVRMSVGRSFRHALSSSIVFSSEESAVTTEASLEGKLHTGTGYKLQWSYLRFRGDSPFLLSSFYYETDLSLTLTQPLLKNRGRDVQLARIKGAELSAQRQKVHLKEVAEEVALEVVRAYLQLLWTEEAYKVAEFGVKLGRQNLLEVKEKIKEGLLAQVETYTAEAELSERKAHLIEAEARLNDARDRLKYLIGLETSKTPTVQTVPYEQGFLCLEESLERALKQRTELLKLSYELKRTEILEGYYRNQALPGLDLSVTYGLSGIATDSDEALKMLTEGANHNWAVSLSFQMPLFTRPVKAEYQKVRLQRLQTAEMLKQKRKEIELEVRTRYRALKTAEQQRQAKTVVMEAQRKRYEAERERFHLGLGTLNDLLRAEEAYLSSLLELKKAEITLMVRFYELKASEGGLLDELDITWR